MEGYDVALICHNGHVVTSALHLYGNGPYCSTCGEPTTKTCDSCAEPIRGAYFLFGQIGGPPYERPSYCHGCGAPYTWTKHALAAAKEFAALQDGWTPEERSQLAASLDDLIRDSPRTPVAATRFKKLAAKIGVEGANGLKQILVSVVSEVAKKIIWPGSAS